MFAFFRRYQRFFFLIVTAVVVVSFSFFGTYSNFASAKEDNSVVFVGIDGSKVRRIEFTDYVQFFSSEGGNNGAFTPPNSGFITNEILQKGIGSLIWKKIANGQELLLESSNKERKYVPYTHPQYQFLGLESVWTYFAPNVSDAYKNYRQLLERQEMSPEFAEKLFDAKVKLYCAQTQFPPTLARQVLFYQMKQLGDRNFAVDSNRLALFGYESLQNWFQKPFVDACVVWIYNIARIAEKEGVQVSDKEVLFEMLKQCQEFLNKEPSLKQQGVESSVQLLHDSLRRMGLDERRATLVMRDVLLYRKFFERLGTAVPVAPQVFESLVENANSFVRLVSYQLPEELRLKNQEQMYKIQLWIDAVRKGAVSSNWEGTLELPKEIKTVQELQKNYPQLVQKQFHVQWAAVDSDDIAESIPLREIWSWQTSNIGWKKLQDTFTELKAINANNATERLAIVDELPQAKREEIDLFSRKNYLLQNPIRIRDAILQAEMKPAVLSVRLEKSVLPFSGITQPESFKKLLSEVVIGELDPRFECYTQDNRYYIRLIVNDRPLHDEVISLGQALSDGTLESLLDETAQTAYSRIRSQNPKSYLQENGEWKPLTAVREEILEKHFSTLISALDRATVVYKVSFPTLCDWEQVKEARMAVRFMPFINSIWNRVEKEPGVIAAYVDDAQGPSGFDDQHKNIQWKLKSKMMQIVRKEGSPLFSYKSLLDLSPGALVSPHFRTSEGVVFASIIEKGVDSSFQDLNEKTMTLYREIGDEVIFQYAQKSIADMNLTPKS